MKKKKKTFNNIQINKFANFSQNKNLSLGKNKYMQNENKNGKCNIHVMPSTISDEDISALFQGLLNVVKKKFELDSQSRFINVNFNLEKLKNDLKSKINECNRLKNEIIHLKSLLNQK